MISAGYLNYNRIAGKWGFQGGVRAEHTTSAGVLTAFTSQNDARVDRKYLNFFPSAAITYTQSDKSVFNLTFSRRIDRPGYQDLNPFEFRLDELSSRKGNAFLQSQYSNAVTLSHTFMYMVNTSISLSRTNGFFTEITDTTGSSRSYLQVRNLGYQDNFGFNIGSPLPIKKWWNGYVNMNIYQLHNRASFGEGKTIDLKFNSISLYMQQTFTLSKKLNFELSGWYNGPGVWGATFKNSALGGMDVAMKLDVFKGRGNLRIAYGDLLRTMHWRGVSEYGGLFLDVRGGWESQLFRVNFSWKFGNDQLKTKERKDGSEDLNKRVH